MNLRRDYSANNKRLAPNDATIDHLRGRYNPTRAEPAEPNEERRVLACNACNIARSRYEMAAMGMLNRLPLAQKPLDRIHLALVALTAKPPKQQRKPKMALSIKALQCELAWRDFPKTWEWLSDFEEENSAQ